MQDMPPASFTSPSTGRGTFASGLDLYSSRHPGVIGPLSGGYISYSSMALWINAVHRLVHTNTEENSRAALVDFDHVGTAFDVVCHVGRVKNDGGPDHADQGPRG